MIFRTFFSEDFQFEKYKSKKNRERLKEFRKI